MALTHITSDTGGTDALNEINKAFDLADNSIQKDGTVAMIGPLTLSGDATNPKEAVPKQQLDAHAVHMDPVVAALIFGG